VHISPNYTNFLVAACVGLSTGYRILTELYIETLLADETLADQLSALWDAVTGALLFAASRVPSQPGQEQGIL
jgi:hypothetical protein